MSFALCHLSVVPLRNSSSDRSEQVSQLLFGEMVEILETKGRSWSKVRCIWDNCIGWAQTRQLKAITPSEKQTFEQRYAFCLDLFQPLHAGDFSIPVTIGAHLPDFDGMKFQLDGKTYHYSGQAVFPENLQGQTDKLLKIAKRYLHAPYQWGGRSPLGIDAAGFVQVIFKLAGIHMHREAAQQVFQGEIIDFIEQALPGDIAFFENQMGNVSHTGIILPDLRIIHVAEQVRIDKIDHFGIFNEDLQRYTNKLRVIKRVLPLTTKFASVKKEESSYVSSQVGLFD
jgi:hypothetical protein